MRNFLLGEVRRGNGKTGKASTWTMLLGLKGGGGHTTTLDCFLGMGVGAGLVDVSMFNIRVHVGATSELCN